MSYSTFSVPGYCWRNQRSRVVSLLLEWSTSSLRSRMPRAKLRLSMRICSPLAESLKALGAAISGITNTSVPGNACCAMTVAIFTTSRKRPEPVPPESDVATKITTHEWPDFFPAPTTSVYASRSPCELARRANASCIGRKTPSMPTSESRSKSAARPTVGNCAAPVLIGACVGSPSDPGSQSLTRSLCSARSFAAMCW